MITVIIPIHNQGKYIKDILSHYEKQTMLPDELVFVLDRCTDNSNDILKEIDTNKFKIFWYIKEDGEGHQAGAARDFALSIHSDSDFYIFTDGDCLPTELVVQKHVEALSFDHPILSVGKRECYDQYGNCCGDTRTHFCESLFDADTVLLERSYSSHLNIAYSCNFALNKKGVELCKGINKRLSNSDRLFNSEFDGKYGFEDEMIGFQLFHFGGFVSVCHKDAHVKHMWHPTNPSSRNNNDLIFSKLHNDIKANDVLIVPNIFGGYLSDLLMVIDVKSRDSYVSELLELFSPKTINEEICYRYIISPKIDYVVDSTRSFFDDGNIKINLTDYNKVKDVLKRSVIRFGSDNKLHNFGMLK